MRSPHDEQDDHGPDVGTLHEETVRLLGALGEWARQDQTEQAGPEATEPSGDCRYCPVCQVIHVVRGTSPEVREHLTTAATALLQVAAELMATHPPRPGASGTSAMDEANGSAVERIDLDEEPGDPAP